MIRKPGGWLHGGRYEPGSAPMQAARPIKLSGLCRRRLEFFVAMLADRQVDDGRKKPEQDADIPDQIVRARRVEDVAAEPDAQERADLVTEERDAVERAHVAGAEKEAHEP